MKKKFSAKLLSVLLAVTLLAGVIPAGGGQTALANDEPETLIRVYADADDTHENPLTTFAYMSIIDLELPNVTIPSLGSDDNITGYWPTSIYLESDEGDLYLGGVELMAGSIDKHTVDSCGPLDGGGYGIEGLLVYSTDDYLQWAFSGGKFIPGEFSFKVYFGHLAYYPDGILDDGDLNIWNDDSG
jgi:hypothetical protein